MSAEPLAPALSESVGEHPAQFTDSIIDALRPLLIAQGVTDVHDPFAGPGKKLAALCDELGIRFTGTDLEPWRGRDCRVYRGDSTIAETYPFHPFAVVTSPTYNNGVNDHFQPKDGSTRLTYRVRLGRALHINNTGRYSGRGSKKAEAEYWRLTREIVKHWPDLCFVNVKDSPRSSWEGGWYPLVQMWTDLLIEFGYTVERIDVECPGWRFGQNGQDRDDTEAILVAHRTIEPDQSGEPDPVRQVTLGPADTTIPSP